MSSIKSIWISKSSSLIGLYTGIGSDGSQHQRKSVQSLMLLDNLHDFGHNRRGYNSHLMDGFCDPKKYDRGKFPCIFKIILNKLNQTSLIFSRDGNYIFTYEMFKIIGWEKIFLSILLDHTNITTMPKSLWSKTFFILKCWSQDTTKKAHKSIKTFLETNSNYVGLATSHFDACGGTCKSFSETVKNSPPGSILFNLPFPSGNDNVLYEYDAKQGILQRTFPQKYGRGTVFNELLKDGRECKCTAGDKTNDCIPIAPGSHMGKRRCFFRRVDKLSVDNYKGKSTVPQDSIQEVASELYQYLDYKYPSGETKASFNDIEFFITVKALSDMAQCAEAKIRNCYLLTQDTMQLIIGCKLGVQMIDYGGKKVIVSNPTIIAYIYDIQDFLAKKGIKMPPTSALKSIGSVDKYTKKVETETKSTPGKVETETKSTPGKVETETKSTPKSAFKSIGSVDKYTKKVETETKSTPGKVEDFIRFCLSCIFYLLYYFASKGFYWTGKGVIFTGKKRQTKKEKIE